MSYSILIVSTIPVATVDGHQFSTMALWARDLKAQAQGCDIKLLCPVTQGFDEAGISSRIKVYDSESILAQQLSQLINGVNVVQLPGNFGWKQSRLSRRILRVARKRGKIVIVGISSNRARTAILNSRNKVKGALQWLDVRTSQAWLTFWATGVFVVGEGLRHLPMNANVHCGVASWISNRDIAPRDQQGPVRFCVASRLEKMKGVHLAIEAFGKCAEQLPNATLTIIGDGPERGALEVQAKATSDRIAFVSPLSYPQPFLSALRQQSIVVLPNLNDEQPRLIFDAISQGCVPLCPDARAYSELGLDGCLYRHGSSDHLAHAMIKLGEDAALRAKTAARLLPLCEAHTIETMHQERNRWIVPMVRYLSLGNEDI